MIVVDFETTSLLSSDLVPLVQQPHIIEVGLMRVQYSPEEGWHEQGRYTTLVRPPIPIPAESVKITGITDAMVADAPTFDQVVMQLANEFLGQDEMVAHNLPFDATVLRIELQRLGMEFKFPWPMYQYCTVERTQHLTGKYQSLQDLSERLLGERPAQTHRAMEDVELLVKLLPRLREEGWL